MKLRILSFVAAAALLAACDGSSTGPGAGPPARLDIVSGDAQQGVAGQELPQPLVVKVVDAKGKPVSGQIVNFHVTAGGGSVFAGAAQTDAAGEARERWTLGPVAADSQRVEARAVNSTTGEAIVFAVFKAVAVAGSASALQVVGSPTLTAPLGSNVDSLTARVVDANGNPVSNAQVTWVATGGGAVVSPGLYTSNAQGMVKARLALSTLVDSAQRAEARLGSAVAAFTVNTTVDSSIVAFTKVGDGQSGPPGAAVPQPAGVRLTLKADGRPVIGAKAYWNGSGVTQYTDAQGYAYFPFTFSSTLGTKTYSIILSDATHQFGWVDLNFTTVAGTPASAVAPAGTFWLAGPGAAAGTHYTPTLDLTDASGNPTAGVTVTWQVVTGDGMVAQAQTTSNANGRVTNDYTLGSAGYQELKVTIPGAGTRMFFAGTSPHTYTGHILPASPDPLTVAVNGTLDVSVEVRDETGALYPNTQGLHWGWGTTPGTGSLGNFAYAGWFNRYLGQAAGTATISVQIVPPQCHIAPCPPADVPGMGTVTRNVVVQ